MHRVRLLAERGLRAELYAQTNEKEPMSKDSKKSGHMWVYRAGEGDMENPSPLPCPASVINVAVRGQPQLLLQRILHLESRCEWVSSRLSEGAQ